MRTAVLYLCFVILTVTFFSDPGVADTAAEKSCFSTDVREADLDAATFAEWVDGKEIGIAAKDKRDQQNSPAGVVFTTKSFPHWRGRDFGNSKTPGPRHLRVGFKNEKAVGALIVTGNVGVSVLKPGVTYPGDLAEDSQWIPAQRLEKGKMTNAEPKSGTSVCTWVLPAGTRTRALRFTHTAQATDKKYQGSLKGAYILATRFANVAPFAQVVARNHGDRAGRLNNNSMDGFWGVWDNIAALKGERAKTIEEEPEDFTLVWPQPVALSGLSFIFPGFRSADIQIYSGPEDRHPRDAAENDWTTVKTASGLDNFYPFAMGINWVPFDKVITTRALRIRMTAPQLVNRSHPHIRKKINDGKRVWLGEIQAFDALGDGDLTTVLPTKETIAQGGIPVPVTMPEDGYVTLVIEDKNGKRIRNLVSETPLPEGDNTIWWDGADDLSRDSDAAWHGLYKVPFELVKPGEYTVRGLWRKKIEKIYEFGIYNEGKPPWGTDDHTGAWLANHSSPQAALFVPAEQSPTGAPAVFLGCYVTEGPDGLGWFDLDGRKRGGKKWIGGNWTAAPYLARDSGSKCDRDVYCYVASVWSVGKKTEEMELRVTGITRTGQDKPIARFKLESTGKPYGDHLGGVAGRNKVVACSMTREDRVDLIDADTGKVVERIPVKSPRGIVYNRAGNLLVLSDKKLLEIDLSSKDRPRKVIISAKLDDPVGLTLGENESIYISDHGNSNQVKVFDNGGKFLRAIGHAGAPKAGPYDPLHMNHPFGLTIDSNHHLWVAENDPMPKRVSIWTLDGKLVKAFYGPAKYGGGGVIDSRDKTRFYYAEDSGTMEFKLDWAKGTWDLVNILSRRTSDSVKMPFRCANPETAIYREVGEPTRKTVQRYFTNCYNSNPVSGHGTAFLYIEREHVLHPVAGMGSGMDWQSLFQEDAFKSLLPEGIDINGKRHQNGFFFIWSDLNSDGKPQANEFQFSKQGGSGITVLPDLSFCVARLGKKGDNCQSVRFEPVKFSADGVPVYDLSQQTILMKNVKSPGSSGGNQALVDGKGNAVVTLGAGPYDKLSICGGANGEPTWSYPDLWPGLHASHHAAKPSFPGELIGTTRLLGGMFTVAGSDAGPMFALNGNMGNFYIFTSDGLFVATVFEDSRRGKRWRMPVGKRGMNLAGISLSDENFWPTISKTSDGNVYAMAGSPTCIVRLDGLQTVRRIAPKPLTVTADDLRRAMDHRTVLEVARKKEVGSGVMSVPFNSFVPKVDGKIDEWPNRWVEIDRSGAGANFNSTSKPYDLRGAVAVADGKLFAAWRTANRKLLVNSGEMPLAPFRTGGSLDLMLGTAGQLQRKSANPVAGDLRLNITMVKGKPFAVLYRPVVPGTQTAKIPFSSPARTFEFDRVDNVSDQVQLAGDGKGNFEISVPLDVLGLEPKPGMRIRGDIGIIRGDGNQAIARTYWSNKATAIVADIPEEAKLSPALWGIWELDKQ